MTIFERGVPEKSVLKIEDERAEQQQHVSIGRLRLLRECAGHGLRHPEDRGAQQDGQRKRRGQSPLLLQKIRSP